MYINIDDVYRNFKENNKAIKYQVRVIQISQKPSNSTDNFNHKYINRCNVAILNKETNKENINQITQRILNQVIQDRYGNLDWFQTFYTCDADTQLQKVGISLNTNIVLDKWHCLSRVSRTYNYKNFARNNQNLSKQEKIEYRQFKKLYCNLIINNLKSGNIDKAIAFAKNSLDLAYLDEAKRKSIKSLIRYLIKNKDCIKIWNNKDYSGSITESEVQKILKSHYGDVGKIHCKENFVHILNTKSLVYLI